MPYTLSEKKEGTEISVEASSASDAFMDGARALFSIMADSEHLKGDERVKIVVDAKDMPSLFVSWLKELSERSEQYNILFGECSIASIQKVNDSQYLLTGAAYGENFDSSKHTRKKVIKSIKHSLFKEQDDNHRVSCSCIIA